MTLSVAPKLSPSASWKKAVASVASLSMTPSQLLSTPLQSSSAPGRTAASASLQSSAAMTPSPSASMGSGSSRQAMSVRAASAAS